MNTRLNALIAVVRRHKLDLDQTIDLLHKLNIKVNRPIRTNRISLDAYNKLAHGIMIPRKG